VINSIKCFFVQIRKKLHIARCAQCTARSDQHPHPPMTRGLPQPVGLRRSACFASFFRALAPNVGRSQRSVFHPRTPASHHQVSPSSPQSRSAVCSSKFPYQEISTSRSRIDICTLTATAALFELESSGASTISSAAARDPSLRLASPQQCPRD
jgi:hypothetical protein